jgi:cobalt-zinc-cadmium efflux system membrane fusion protein
VKKGQVLARLRSHNLGQAQAEYLEALARFDLARAERTRIEGLWKDGIVAESRWLAVNSEYKGARATLDARHRLLSLTGLSDPQIQALAQKPDRLAEFELTSPIDGMVTGVEIESGQLLTAGEIAFHVDDLSTLWAEVQIPVADLAQIKPGTEAMIQVPASPGRDYRGQLQSLAGEVDRQSQTLGGRIVVDNPDGQLRPGMYATVTLAGVAEQGLMVPASAVFRIGEQTWVFKVLGPRRYAPVAIEIGSEAAGWIPVHRGIALGAEIVSGGVAELKSHWQYHGGE